jgi:hypothetical protein
LSFIARVFLTNQPAPTGEEAELPDPSIAPNELIVGDDGPFEYNGDNPPALLGYELLDREGCVLYRVGDWTHGQERAGRFFGEVEVERDLESAHPIRSVNVIAVTEFRIVEVPFEAPLIDRSGRSRR